MIILRSILYEFNVFIKLNIFFLLFKLKTVKRIKTNYITYVASRKWSKPRQDQINHYATLCIYNHTLGYPHHISDNHGQNSDRSPYLPLSLHYSLPHHPCYRETWHFLKKLISKKTRPQAGETKPPSQASGKNPTAVPIAQAATTNKSSTTFGLVVVINDPLTVKP